MKDGQLSNLQLLQRARHNDPTASRELIVRLRDPLLDRIRLMMGDRVRRLADSIDFLQEVMVEFLEESLDIDFCSDGEILRWLTAVARNNIRDAARRRRVRAFDSLSASFSAEGVRDGGPSPASRVAMHEDTIRLAEGLEKLKPDYRQVIDLHNLEGLGLREVARRMERTYEGVKKLHTRAMIQLGSLLSSSGQGRGKLPKN